MSGFYITRICVTGTGLPDSAIDLCDGVNIIYGPSNTGKTYVLKCIDYLFGADHFPIEEDRGYDMVTMHIVGRDGGECTVRRRLSEKKVEIIGSTLDSIKDGEYTIASNQFRRLYLALIGIKDTVSLVSKQDYTKTQMLTWRTLEPMFFIQEELISRSDSIVTTSRFPNMTPALSALKYCYDGEQVDCSDLSDTNAIAAGRKVAVSFISGQLQRLQDERNQLEASLAEAPYKNVEEALNEQTSRLEQLNRESQELADQEQELLRKRIEVSDQLREVTYMQDRFASLADGYRSDIRRLQFVIEGEEQRPETPTKMRCPLCAGDMTAKRHRSLAPAARQELGDIELQLRELTSLMEANGQEITDLETRLEDIKDQQRAIEETIVNTYKPQVLEVQGLINNLVQYQKLSVRLDSIREIIEGLDADIQGLETGEELKLHYNVRTLLGDEFYVKYNQYLEGMLRACNYDDFRTCYLDRTEFDIVVDGKKKRSQGKGYRAFLNTVMAYTILRLLSLDGVYSPGLLILDSPILSLKETNEQASSAMKANLFRMMMDTDFTCQIIIAENEIPKVDYSKANMIHFTKDPKKGRYGFLMN